MRFPSAVTTSSDRAWSAPSPNVEVTVLCPPELSHPPVPPTVLHPAATTLILLAAMRLETSHASTPDPIRTAIPLYSPIVYERMNSVCFSQCVQTLSDPAPTDLPPKSCPVFLPNDTN